MLYRVHLTSSLAIDINVWGGKGWPWEPDCEGVAPVFNHWASVGPNVKTTRQQVAKVLCMARDTGCRVERFRR